MGLKIRRLKSGFAYYAEYKLGKHCIYEKIQAGSAREAKRIYAARDKELRKNTPVELRALSIKDSRDQRVTAALSAMLRKLVSKQVITEAEALELLPEFSNLPPSIAPVAPIVPAQAAAQDAPQDTMATDLARAHG
jgi:hypothetical protein